jgi:hypothetical protein
MNVEGNRAGRRGWEISGERSWLVRSLVVLRRAPTKPDSGTKGVRRRKATRRRGVHAFVGNGMGQVVECASPLALWVERGSGGGWGGSGAQVGRESGRGLPHSKTLRDRSGVGMSARSWSAPVLWRFGWKGEVVVVGGGAVRRLGAKAVEDYRTPRRFATGPAWGCPPGRGVRQSPGALGGKGKWWWLGGERRAGWARKR